MGSEDEGSRVGKTNGSARRRGGEGGEEDRRHDVIGDGGEVSQGFCHGVSASKKMRRHYGNLFSSVYLVICLKKEENSIIKFKRGKFHNKI